MARPAFGFDPPPFDYPRELRWVLTRAFGPPRGGGKLDVGVAEVAATLSERLDLAARIGARVPAQRLRDELGDLADRFRQATLRAVGLAVRQQEATNRVAAVAAELGVSIVLLKGAALFGGGHVALGSRTVADLDVLAAQGGAERLQTGLLSCGFTTAGEGYEHHLPPLLDPVGVVVEIHHVLWGVFLGDERLSAQLEELAEAGLLRPQAGQAAGGAEARTIPGGEVVPIVSLPTAPVLAAHLVLHGLVQHGLTPTAYPALRVIGDLLDLGFGAELPIAAVGPLVRGYVESGELAALAALCQRLANGELDAMLATVPAPPARRLLDHLVGGQLDAVYANSLKRRLLERPFSDLPPAAARRAALFHALFPRRSGPGLRQLVRPFDLAYRLLRSQWSRVAIRWRRWRSR